MQELGRYRILGEIARGGQGVVYRARVEGLQREVALKVLLDGGTQKQRERFLREAQALSRLRHPNLVDVYDVGETQGRLYMALELVPGESLQDRLDREGTLPPAEAVRIARATCGAIAHAHDHGLLHRDLKPANVLLTPDGTPRLTDFGLTRDQLRLAQTQLTQTGHFLGTPGYWAPEQARGDKGRQGPASDVWGLGALLYAMLTGSPPGVGESLPELLARLHEPVVPPAEHNPAVPAWLNAVVMRALAIEPEERWPSASALEQGLRAPRRAAARRAASPAPWVAGGIVTLGALGAGLMVFSDPRAEVGAEPGVSRVPSGQVAAVPASPSAPVSPVAALATDDGPPEPEGGLDAAHPRAKPTPAPRPEEAVELLRLARAKLPRGVSLRPEVLAHLDAALELAPGDVEIRYLRLLTRTHVSAVAYQRERWEAWTVSELLKEALALRSAVAADDVRALELDRLRALLTAFVPTSQDQAMAFASVQASAEGHYQRGEFAQALPLFQQALQALPVRPTHLRNTAYALLGLERAEEALPYLLLARRCYEIDAPDAVLGHQYDPALAELERVIAQVQQQLGVHYQEAPPPVRPELEQVRAVEGQRAEGMLEVARRRMAGGGEARLGAVSLLGELLEIDPAYTDARYLRALAQLYVLRQPVWSARATWTVADVVADLERVRDEIPDEDERQLELRTLFRLLEGHSPAGEAAAPSRTTEAQALYARGEYAQALPLFEAAVHGSLVTSEDLRNLGFTLLGLGREQEAFAYCLLAYRCYDLNPTDLPDGEQDPSVLQLRQVLDELRAR